tara:strand:+ start:522 stop:878 length:357 start_codon:yes stop_codon:yes gene_type:complete
MGIAILIVSAVLFISTFGIHSFISNGHEFDKPVYTSNPLMSSIPWISGFIIPVVIWTQITDFHWIALFFINLAVVWILGPMLTKGFLVRFASGKGLGKDMLTAFVAGIVSLIIGLLVK